MVGDAHVRSLRPVLPVAALALVLGVLVVVLSRSPGYFVGDSADYYALYLAWKDTLLPFMTEQSWAEYARRFSAETWHMPVPPESARAAAHLRVGATADFSHFWFYSLLAASIGYLLDLVGFPVRIHTAFVTLHWLLLTMVCVLARKHFGWRGLAATLLLTLLSPMLWYVDKVHTEFFTYTLVLSSVIVFLRGRYLEAALFLAVASTQNISFGAVAVVPFVLDVMARRSLRYSGAEIRLLAATAVTGALHPVYYLIRHGSIEPQVLGGGVNFGAHLSSWYIWFFDLDIGLFSNWPLGLGLVALGIWIRLQGRSPVEDRRRWLVFVLAYLGLSLFAQSSTINLNSGGTRSIARYATWYLPLFFPALIMVLEWMRSASRTFSVAACALLLVGGAYNLSQYHPRMDENSRVPTPLSEWVQTHLPTLYDPPPEIFSERFGGLGESRDLNRAIVVVGPDCRKVLIFNQEGRTDVLGGAGCGLQGERVREAIQRRLAQAKAASGSQYAMLDADEMRAARYQCSSRVEFRRGGDLPQSAVAGFGLPEGRGRWTEGSPASFTCWLDLAGGKLPASIVISTSAFVPKGHSQRLRLSFNDSPSHEVVYEKEWEVKTLELQPPPVTSERLRLTFEMPDAVSPRRLGVTPDPRMLGIWIDSIEVRRP